jgi:hypothetical protein
MLSTSFYHDGGDNKFEKMHKELQYKDRMLEIKEREIQ